MTDSIQQLLQAWATHDAVTRAIVIVCAAAVTYVLGVAWVVIVAGRRDRLRVADVARVVALALAAYVASTVLTGLVPDPRPYLVAHAQPLIPISRDNGFPSDHTLLAAALTVSLWWIDRRLAPVFAVCTVLVALGRLGVGAHHTLDVVGSIAIAVTLGALIGLVPLPTAWSRPFLPVLRTVARAIRRPIVRRDPLA